MRRSSADITPEKRQRVTYATSAGQPGRRRSDARKDDMTTNKTISKDSELEAAAKALMQAAHSYWQVYQRELGASAVVWIENDNGHFILFTRSEYKSAIMESATRETAEAKALFEPFSEPLASNSRGAVPVSLPR